MKTAKDAGIPVNMTAKPGKPPTAEEIAKIQREDQAKAARQGKDQGGAEIPVNPFRPGRPEPAPKRDHGPQPALGPASQLGATRTLGGDEGLTATGLAPIVHPNKGLDPSKDDVSTATGFNLRNRAVGVEGHPKTVSTAEIARLAGKR